MAVTPSGSAPPPDEPPVAGEPTLDLLDADAVAVPRSSLRGLRGLVLGMMVGGVLSIGAFAWGFYRQDDFNRHLTRTDAQAIEDRQALERLVRRETREEEVESAVRCVRDHLRYERFIELAKELTAAGATVGADAHLQLMGGSPDDMRQAHDTIEALLPGAVQPIIDQYPPPSCDRAEAQAVIQAAPPELLNSAMDG